MYVGKGSTTSKPPKKVRHTSLAKESRNVVDDSSYFSPHVYGVALPRNGDEWGAENRVTFNLYFKSRRERSDIKARLQHELMLVRNLVMIIEQLSASKMPVDSGAPVRNLKRAHSEGGSVDGHGRRPTEPTNVNERKNKGDVGATPASVARGVSQKSSAGRVSVEIVTRPVLTERLNAGGVKRNMDEFISTSVKQNSLSDIFKSCSALLSKLMRSKGGWVFKKPVDVACLGLHDYFAIIKHPMDLGTIKARLANKRYSTPEEFAEDVRLTFHNAMTYNMEGHEVHTFAKDLLQMFEDNWANIETSYLCKSITASGSEVDLRTSVSYSASIRSLITSAPPLPPVATTSLPRAKATLSLSPPTDVAAKGRSDIASGKAHLHKPKVRDVDIREMTLEEKEKLSSELQNLPSEKLEGVLLIIKKRNPSIYQNDEEIEVDIDTVDTETLWELDRYVINHKKAWSKLMRRTELAQIGGGVTDPKLHEMNQIDAGVEEANENDAGENNTCSSSSNERNNADCGNTTSASNGSSSSSIDSSSSSDSDTNFSSPS